MKKYKYYIVFIIKHVDGRFGFGSGFSERSKKIKTEQDLKDIGTDIEKQVEDCKCIIIQNWKRIKPGK